MKVELMTVDSGAHKGTISALIVDDTVCCWALELPWKDNHPNISCVPTGEYELRLEWSSKFNRELYELKGVSGRSECKFHIANRLHEIQGCISPGIMVRKIDNEYSVAQSTAAFNKFMMMMKGREKDLLIISNRP